MTAQGINRSHWNNWNHPWSLELNGLGSLDVAFPRNHLQAAKHGPGARPLAPGLLLIAVTWRGIDWQKRGYNLAL